MTSDRMRRSRAQEERSAALLGGRRHKGSGNGPFQKGDGSTRQELVECKRTDNKKQITLLVTDLVGVYKQALIEAKTPLLEFELAGQDYVVLRKDDYLEIRSRVT